MRHQKSARELQKEGSKSYNIQALPWQQSQDLGLTTNAQTGLGQSSQSLPNSIVCPLSHIPRGSSVPLPKQQIYREKQIVALKELTRLMELVTEQEKKYRERLSPHSNFFQYHFMVQQFLHTQLKKQSSQSRRDLALTISRGFGRGFIPLVGLYNGKNCGWKKEKFRKEKIETMEIYGCMMAMSMMQSKNLLEHKEIVSIMVTNNIIGLSFYKLVQFLKNYVNPQEVEIPIIICSRTT